jgi:nitroimidazol reductase NimA-like FMN-containing flavoprotein (pyridoxamine 5'-phosphate oxidase superfamily)
MPRPAVADQLRIRRNPDRAAYDADVAAEILDAGFVCHVAAIRDGLPVVVPTLYVRDGDRLILHGSPAAGMFRTAGRDPQVCVAVTHVDGLVLARSAFHHSINYRSVVVHGQASQITADDARVEALRTLVERVTPGQWDVVRHPDADELRQTDVWELPWAQASMKIRSGPPKDDEPDLALPVWAGVVPLTMVAGAPVPDQFVPATLSPPAHVAGWSPESRSGSINGK